MEKQYNAFEFNDEVKSRIEKRLIKYSLQHVAEVDNTHEHPAKREHFCSTNISSILHSIFRTYNIFSVSKVKYKLEDSDEYDIGESAVFKNRRDFLVEIDLCEDILQFIFLTFNFR
jgi:hypothetical protein